MTGLRALAEATDRLASTVGRLPDDAWSAPSILPGWSRAHVVAHLALNAEGLAGVVRGVLGGERVPMYRSPEARDADIEALADEPPDVVRRRLAEGADELAERLAALDGSSDEVPVERTPGGPVFPAGAVLAMREREVEVHHADLRAGYGPDDWPAPFVVALLGKVTDDQAGDGPFTVVATDLDRLWQVGGEGGPVVRGPGAALGWWLTGRGGTEGLEAPDGVPALGPWRAIRSR